MKRKKFMINALILTGFTLAIRIIAMVFRVFMSNKMGPEAIGLYQLIVIIYFFSATLVTSGTSLMITRIVSESFAMGNFMGAKKAINKCILISLGLSVICAIALFFFADYIGYSVLVDERAILPLKILAPSLIFMSISSCFRGYFLATREIGKAASEQLLEQIVEIAVFALLIGKLAPMGISYACCAIVAGTTAAEIVSALFSYILYRADINKLNLKRSKLAKIPIIKKLISIWAPVTGSACLRSGLSMVENIMIPSGLKSNGASYEKSLSSYGMINGMVMPVITFPSAFLMSFSLLLIPEFSEENTKNNKKNIKYIAHKVFSVTFYFSIFITGIFIVFGKDLGKLIYNNEAAGLYIALLAPILPLMYLDSIVDGMLKGLNYQLSYFTYNIIDSVIRVILIFFLLPIMGINGLIVVIFVSEILNSTLSIAKLLKVTELKLEVMRWIIKPIIAIVFPCLVFYFTSEITLFLIPDPLIRVIIKITVCLVIYVVLLFLFKSLTHKDIEYFKKIIIRQNIKNMPAKI